MELCDLLQCAFQYSIQITTSVINFSTFLESGIAATVVGGPKTFGRTNKLNSRRSLGDQTTLGTNKIQKAERERKLDIPIELDKNFDFPF